MHTTPLFVCPEEKREFKLFRLLQIKKKKKQKSSLKSIRVYCYFLFCVFYKHGSVKMCKLKLITVYQAPCGDKLRRNKSPKTFKGSGDRSSYKHLRKIYQHRSQLTTHISSFSSIFCYNDNNNNNNGQQQKATTKFFKKWQCEINSFVN